MVFSLGILLKTNITMDTSSPLAMTSFSLAPRSEPEATSSRRRSPEDRWQKPNFSTILAHCVPFPLPGPPINCQVKENIYKELDKCDICLYMREFYFIEKMGGFLQYISYLVFCDCFPLRPQVDLLCLWNSTLSGFCLSDAFQIRMVIESTYSITAINWSLTLIEYGL